MDASFKHKIGSNSALAATAVGHGAASICLGDPGLAALALMRSARVSTVEEITKRQASEPDTFWARVGDRWNLGIANFDDTRLALAFHPALINAGAGGILLGAFFSGFFESSKHGVVKPWFAGLSASQT